MYAAPPPDYATTGSRLGRAVLAYVAAVVAVITLEPFAFGRRASLAVHWWATGGPWGGWFDVAANVALFAPLGFVAAMTLSARARAGTRAPGPAAVAAAGALLSAAIEAAQCFEPGRYPSPTDVLTNAVGAWAGALAYARAAGRLGADSPLVGRLSLELPVMGLVYVAMPLLTLAALTADGGAPASPGWPAWFAPRAAGLAMLGGFGGVLLGTVQRRQFGPAGTARAAATAAAAGAWFAAGALPALGTAPLAWAAGAAGAAGAAWLVGRRGAEGVRAIERRFEGEALARAAPWLACYVALLPLGDAAGAAWGRPVILRHLEVGAAYTVLGYVLAEAWGRREWRYRHSAWRVAAVAGAAAAVAATAGAAAAGQPPDGWEALAVALRGAAAAYGGWLYHLQRAHVRALVAARGAARFTATHARRRAA